MTYRELLDKLELMAEWEPALLNQYVMCSLEDNEFFMVENIMIEPLGNQFVDKKQPLLIITV